MLCKYYKKQLRDLEVCIPPKRGQALTLCDMLSPSYRGSPLTDTMPQARRGE